MDAICKTANKTRAFLQRNSKGCPRDVKSHCYNIYVRPIVEYAPVVWDPAGEGNQQLNYQVEMVRLAARFMTGDWISYDQTARLGGRHTQAAIKTTVNAQVLP